MKISTEFPDNVLISFDQTSSFQTRHMPRENNLFGLVKEFKIDLQDWLHVGHLFLIQK